MAPLRSAALPSPAASRLRSVTGLQAGVTLLVSLMAGLALVASPNWWMAFGLVGVAALTAYGLTNPAGLLALFLMVRPLLDEFSQATAGVPSANLAGALGAFLFGITIIVLTLRRTRFSVPGTVPLLAVVAISAVAALQAQFEVGSVLETRAISELVRLAALVAVFLLAAQVTRSVARAETLFVIVAMSAVIPALYGMYELIHGVEAKGDEGVARISGTFTGPVPFGAFLALTSLILLFGPVREKLPAWLRWSALALMLFALLESYSRFGWVVFILGLFILAWPRQKRIVVVGLVGVAVALAASGDVRHRALPVSGDAPTSGSEQSGGYESYDWRISNWEGLLDKWAEKPVLGWGLKSTEFVNPRSPAETVGVVGGGFDAHNMIVRTLVEGGVVLLAVYLGFFALMIRRTWRLSRARWDLAEASRLLMVLWGLILFAGATTDDPFSLTAVMVGLFALTGAVEGAWRLHRAEGGEPVAGKSTVRAPASFWSPASPGAAHPG